MDWTQILVVIGANLGTTISLFLWARHESTEDRRMHAEDRRDFLHIVRSIEQEMKDFHGRLCAIEERARK